jgi:hypothetical protein
MMVMPANHSSPLVHYLAGAKPGRIGWLVGPSSLPKTKLRAWMPFACDNDAFSAWTNQTPWDEEAWLAMLRRVQSLHVNPLWVLVPDVVANKEQTLVLWDKYAPVAAAYKWPLAFALQDGMSPGDVPSDADLVFVGGTTEWKWRSLPMWCDHFPRVHVGRVNELDKLWVCQRLGVESVDGTGWFRDGAGGRRERALECFMNYESDPQPEFQMAH